MKLNTKTFLIPDLRFISTVIGFVVAFVLVLHTISESNKSTYARCQSNVGLVAQHLERVTQQSARTVKGVAAWLAKNPTVNFRSNRNLLALSPVLNIDPQDSHAIAIIEENGQAWLLDEKYAGKSFDVSGRPYFEIVRSMEVGQINYGPRTKNINTGQDTIAIFYKVMFGGKSIVISTAFSVNRVETFLNTIVNNTNLSLLLFNDDHLEIFASNNGINTNLVHLPKPNTTEHPNSTLLPTLTTISCSQNVTDSKFVVVATADPYITFSQSIPLILVIVVLIMIAAATNLLSHRRISALVLKNRRHIENTPLGCISWDKDFHCTEWNKSAETIFGYTAKEAIGNHASELLVPMSAREHVDKIYELLLEQKGGSNSVNENVTKNGSTIVCDWYNTPIIDFDGAVTGVTSLVLDITERKQLEAQLAQAQRMEAVGQLTGGIAHDFNNLLAVMLGNSEMLEDKIVDDKEARKQLNNIIQAVDLASSLTNRLLTFSRQQTLLPVSANVPDLVDGLADMLQRTLGETIDLKVIPNPDLWQATIDPHQFENALVNLVLNARDAMPKGGALTVETANVTLDEFYVKQYEEVAPGDYVRVAVTDTGNGMASEVLNRVFEPFFTTKGVGQGSGLGLSMVYGFAKQSNGHITIYSEEGHGTTVKLYMPRSKQAVADEGTKDISPKFARGSERILIVEDDASVREISVNILRNYGYVVVEAGDGEEAIKRLRSMQSLDLLFTDVVLPGGMNGVEIAEWAKELQPNIKILYTTGYAENAVIHNDKLDPSTILVKKPYRRAELLEKVRKTLDADDR